MKLNQKTNPTVSIASWCPCEGACTGCTGCAGSCYGYCYGCSNRCTGVAS